MYSYELFLSLHIFIELATVGDNLFNLHFLPRVIQVTLIIINQVPQPIHRQSLLLPFLLTVLVSSRYSRINLVPYHAWQLLFSCWKTLLSALYFLGRGRVVRKGGLFFGWPVGPHAVVQYWAEGLVVVLFLLYVKFWLYLMNSLFEHRILLNLLFYWGHDALSDTLNFDAFGICALLELLNF